MSIECHQIETELTRIWESLEGANKMRASLFNLIFFIKKAQRTDYIKKIAKKVIQKFPSRVILITEDPDAKGDVLKANVSVASVCEGACDVACDYIEIEVSESALSRIPFVILPHILADLPVYLFWGEDPTLKDSLFVHLQKFAGRVIFDSESTDSLPRFAKTLLDYKNESHLDVADLNWARLENWRDLLSQAFHSPEKLEELERAKTIHIQYNAQGTPSFCHIQIQPIYLQAWLACQLNWKFQEIKKEGEKLQFIYLRENIPITIELSPVKHTDVPPGCVVSLEMLTDQDHHFSFHRQLDIPNQISFQVSTPESCALPSQLFLSRGESGQSLVKEIGHKGTSEHFLSVLKLITQLDALGIC